MLGRYDRAMRARQPQGGAPFTPRSIGAAVWYDPSDMSTLFQDTAGTVPVTAVGQPVGRMLDKSGRGNHATQATTTKRPVLQIDAGGRYYLSFDGVDDALKTGNIDFTSTGDISIFCGSLSGPSGGGWLLNYNNASGGSFRLTSVAGGTYWNIYAWPNGGGSAEAIGGGGVANTVNTTTSIISVSSKSLVFRNNGKNIATTSAPTWSGAFPNAPLFIGSRSTNSLYFDGRLYGLIVRDAQSTLSQIEATELYMKKKVGIA